MKLTISSKILLSFLLVILLSVVMLTISFFYINEAKTLSSGVLPLSGDLTHLYEEAGMVEILQDRLDNYISVTSPQNKDNLFSQVDTLIKFHEDAESVHTPEEFSKVMSLLVQINSTTSGLVHAIEAQNNAAVNNLLIVDYDALKNLNALESSYINEKISEIGTNIGRQNDLLSSILSQFLLNEAIILLIAITLSTLISRNITSSIAVLDAGATEIAKGNFSNRIKLETQDEFSRLADTLNTAAEELSKLEKERKELDQAKTQFLSISSHELRTPMTPMKAQMQMLEQGYFGKLSGKQKDAINIALKNTERLDSIIDDLLDLSRIEAARLKFNFVQTNLSKTAEDLIKEMDHFLPEKKIKIISKIEKLPSIETDPNRVMQVLRNLINNAKKFSPPRSTITVSAGIKNNMIQFSVKDSGIGLSPENQKRIFEPFFQAEQTIYRTYGGTGLGLTISKGIIEAQGGRIWLESELGKGTTFYFTVPLEPVKEIKPIQLIFSSEKKLQENIKNIFLKYLGPVGEPEFNSIYNQGLRYEIITNYLDKLLDENIIDAMTYQSISDELNKVFQTQTEFVANQAIRKTYVEILGPLGLKRFREIEKNLSREKIHDDIKEMEHKHVISQKEAADFRNRIDSVFEQKKTSEAKESAESRISEFLK